MGFIAGYRFVFSHPRWFKNLLLCSVCMLIPMIGGILLTGYGSDVMRSMAGGRREKYPDFKFDYFLRYLSEGFTVFLVQLVVGLVAMAALLGGFLLLGGVVVLAIYVAPNNTLSLGIVITLAVLLAVILQTVVTLLVIPYQIRAMLTLDFKASMDWKFAWGFFKRTWKMGIWWSILMTLNAMVLMVLGEMACFVGLYPALVVMMLLHWHMFADLYDLHLQRGGEKIPIKELPVLVQEGMTQAGFEVVRPG